MFTTLKEQELLMNLLVGLFIGYIIHDAVQPTPVGAVLDKVSLPADLFVATEPSTTAEA